VGDGDEGWLPLAGAAGGVSGVLGAGERELSVGRRLGFAGVFWT